MQSSQLRNPTAFSTEEDVFIPVNPTIIKLRKTFFLLMFQQAVAIGASYGSLYYEDKYQLSNMATWICLAITLSCVSLGLIMRPQVSRYPTNFFVYLVFMVAFAGLCASVVIRNQVDFFFNGLVGLFLQTIGQFIYINISKQELTFQGPSLYVFGALLIQIEGFMVLSNISIMHLIIGSIFTVLWGYNLFGIRFYLSFDSYIFQQAYWSNMDVYDDYVSGAIFVYLDIPMLVFRVGKLLAQTFSSASIFKQQ